MPRTRTSAPWLVTTTLSLGRTLPEKTVPVTTVPAPLTTNARSIASRKYWPVDSLGTCFAAWHINNERNSAIPEPLRADTGMIGKSVGMVATSNFWSAPATS